jgi:hypothetical protein
MAGSNDLFRIYKPERIIQLHRTEPDLVKSCGGPPCLYWQIFNSVEVAHQEKLHATEVVTILYHVYHISVVYAKGPSVPVLVTLSGFGIVASKALR